MIEHLQRARHRQLVGEHRLLVHLAVAVGVLEDADAVERLLRVPAGRVRQEGQHLEHPQPAVRIELHQDRRLDHRFRGDELDAKSRRQGEGLHLLLGRQGDGLLHLLLGGRPDVARHLGGALRRDRGREADDTSCGESENERVRFMVCSYECVERVVCYFWLAGTSRITMPGVDAASPSPVPEPVGFCSST